MTEFLDREGLKAVLMETKKRIEARLAHAVSITWGELKAKRDAGTLVPGQEYRITDYAFTVSTAKAGALNSGGHQFDIIVTANGETTLSEVARAARHDGDTYFKDCKVEAWVLLYCIDNDTDRFDWADTENGKGVVYRMIDEWDNDVAYDFKNVMFTRFKIASARQSSLVGKIGAFSGNEKLQGITKTSDDSQYCYTFNRYTGGDGSVQTVATLNAYRVYGNVIAPYRENGKQILNDIVFMGGANGNCFGQDCHHFTFLGTRSSAFSANTFDNGCNYFITGYTFQGNTFGNSCQGNTFGNACQRNTFGNACNSSCFGNSCQRNTFGDNVFNITCGNYLRLSSIGTNCTNIIFGDYYSNIEVETGVSYVTMDGNGTSGSYIQNYHLTKGIGGTNPDPYTLHVEGGHDYELTVAKKSDGTVKVYNPADLIS